MQHRGGASEASIDKTAVKKQGGSRREIPVEAPLPPGGINLLQFEALAKLMRSREPARTAARLVLVERRRGADVAKQLSMKPQAVHNTVNRYKRADEIVRAAYLAATQPAAAPA